MVSCALANRTGIQAPENAGGTRSTAQVRRPECAGVAVWQTAGVTARAKAGTTRARYFPLGLPTSGSVAMAARGGFLVLGCTPYNRLSNQRFPCRECWTNGTNWKWTCGSESATASHGLTFIHHS